MAVRAKQLKVLEPVVVAFTVDVVEGHRKWSPAPFGDPADFALIRLQAAAEQAHLEVVAVNLSSPHQVKLDRCGSRPGKQQSDPHCAVPGIRAETERASAVSYGVPLVVVPLDRRPVVPTGESRISRLAQPPRVVADRRLCDVEFERDVGMLSPRSIPSATRSRITPDGYRGPRRRLSGSALTGYPQPIVAGSSNGKTPVSGTGYRGSSPCPAASYPLQQKKSTLRHG
jgi:hypothetical protein